VWIDAKYKDHLRRMTVQDWSALPAALRDSHRADLHQALAYAMLAESRCVDTLLVYPGATESAVDLGTIEPTFALADLVAGERHIRLGLSSIPFGFQGPAHRDSVLSAWEKTLRNAA
jgi:hypothetical protein